MNSDLEELRGYTVGADLALLNAVRAIIRTHPQPQALSAAMETSRQNGLVVLVGSTSDTDKAIETYHQTWSALLADQPA